MPRRAPLSLVFLAFTLSLAAVALQVLCALSAPYLKPIIYLAVNSQAGQTLLFGIWSNCGRIQEAAGYACESTGLGWQQGPFRDLIENVVSTPNLAYALVLEPVAAGFAGLATLGAFFNLCGFTILWPLLALVSFLTAAAALAVELALFIPMRNKFASGSFNVADANGVFAGNNTADFSNITSATFGPAIWMQVGATAATLIAAVFLFVAYAAQRRSDRRDKEVNNFDFEPTGGSGGNRMSYFGGGNRRSKRYTYTPAGDTSYAGANGDSQRGTGGAYYDEDGYYVPDGGQNYDPDAALVAEHTANGSAVHPNAQFHPQDQQQQQHYAQGSYDQGGYDQQGQYYGYNGQQQHQQQYDPSYAHHEAMVSQVQHAPGDYGASLSHHDSVAGSHSQHQHQHAVITPGPGTSGRPRWSQDGAY